MLLVHTPSGDAAGASGEGVGGGAAAGSGTSAPFTLSWPLDWRALAADAHVRGWATALAVLLPLLWALNALASRRERRIAQARARCGAPAVSSRRLPYGLQETHARACTLACAMR
jgi:hypothetical protein